MPLSCSTSSSDLAHIHARQILNCGEKKTKRCCNQKPLAARSQKTPSSRPAGSPTDPGRDGGASALTRSGAALQECHFCLSVFLVILSANSSARVGSFRNIPGGALRSKSAASRNAFRVGQVESRRTSVGGKKLVDFLIAR